MKTVVAIQHVAFENLGSLESVLQEQGYAVTYVNAYQDGMAAQVLAADPDLLVVLGGPIGVYEEDDYPFVADEIALIKQRLQQGKPLLGICLGAQLIAAALGAKVYSSGTKEIGWSPLTLSPAGLDSPLRFLQGSATSVLHWHGDTFTLPEGATLLASTEECQNQAFAYGHKVLGLQFHAEVVGDIEPWLVGHASEIANAAGVTVPVLRRDTTQHVDQLASQARQFFAAWLTRAFAA